MDALNKDLNRLVKLSSDYTFLSFQSYICYKTKNKLPEKPSLRCYAFSFYVFRQRQNGFSWLTASCIMERKLNSLFVFISSPLATCICASRVGVYPGRNKTLIKTITPFAKRSIM